MKFKFFFWKFSACAPLKLPSIILPLGFSQKMSLDLINVPARSFDPFDLIYVPSKVIDAAYSFAQMFPSDHGKSTLFYVLEFIGTTFSAHLWMSYFIPPTVASNDRALISSFIEGDKDEARLTREKSRL